MYVVAIGIEDYERVGDLNKVAAAHADAKDFQDYIASRWKAKAHITLLEGPQATKYGIEDAVYLNLTKAGVNDSVYLFISAHGVMAPHTNAGYILTHESQSGNGPGTGIPLAYFDALLKGRQQPSGPVYLFADVCRQAAPVSNNWIQRGLEELAKDNVSVQGILATRPDKQSIERVFTKALVGAIQQPKPDLDSEYDSFFEEVKKRAPQQVPDKLPLHIPRHVTWYRPAPGFNRYPGEIAMLGSPIPLLFAMQATASTDRMRVQFQEAVANEKLTGPGGAFDLLQALKSLETQSLAAEDTASLLVALEDHGQHVIADYGSGEQFPNDPLKLDAASFFRAADYFEHASMLERPERKDEIDSRTWFCKGRAKLFDGPGQDIDGAATDLDKAARLYSTFPEPYNGLGIVHLAKAKSAVPAQPQQVAAELVAAASQFEKAIAIAPMWAYSRHNLALTYSEEGDFRQAEKTYARAIQLTSFHPYLQYNLGLLLQNENRLREAERQYKSAENVFQTLIGKHTVARNSAAGLRATGIPGSRYYQAQFVLEGKIITALQENLAETYNALGTLREDRHDSTGAEKYYKDALAQADLKEARHNLASLYMSRRDKRGLPRTEQSKLLTAAEDLWILNLSRAPDHRPSLLGLARAYRAEDQPVKAVPLYEKILGLDGEQIAAREELALSLAKTGKVAEAERQLEEAIRRQRAARSVSFANPAMYEELGDLYRGENRTGDACKQYAAARQAQKAGFAAPSDLKEKLRGCPSK